MLGAALVFWTAWAFAVALFASTPAARQLERTLTNPDPEDIDADHLGGTAGVETTNPAREEGIA